MRPLPLLLLLLLSLVCIAGADAGDARINARGQIEAPGRDVRVFRGEARTPLFGSISHEGGAACFSPALPLVAGETYRVEFQRADGSWHVQRVRFDREKPVAAPTVSLAPFPAVLPANALKVYLHFSQPMEQGVFLERITLRRGDAHVVQGAFRETELWSPDGKRLTLWLHPGRQKTGVNLNRDEGPVLIASVPHVLQVSGGWRSTAGVPIGQDYSFPLTVIAADHDCPAPGRWKVSAPKADTRAAVVITFDEPLDPAMAASALSVLNADGTAQAAADGRSWAWTPARPWTRGVHRVSIDPLLEDLAGNNLQHPFEVDREQQAPRAEPQTTMTFDVR